MNMLQEHEFEGEFEAGLHENHEQELEGELEGEQFLGGLLGGLLGEGEGEAHEAHELHELHELEGESHEQSLGGLLGEGELEGELESHELEGEFEGEQFFGGLLKKMKRFAPMLKKVAKFALPKIAGAVMGPMGGQVANLATGLLGEGEAEGEGELEGELEHELEAPMAQHEALAELMAEAAAEAQSSAEAESMIGAMSAIYLTRRDRRALRRMADALPVFVRGMRALTRVLRASPGTRDLTRVTPIIARVAAKKLFRRAARGGRLDRGTVARALTTTTHRVLNNPRACAKAIHRNVRASRAVKRIARVKPVRG